MGHLRWRFYTTSVFVHQFANRNRYRFKPFSGRVKNRRIKSYRRHCWWHKRLDWVPLRLVFNLIFLGSAVVKYFFITSNKLKSSEDNAKPLNKSLFTADCDDCDFKSLHQKWRYLSAKDFVRIDEKFRPKTLPKRYIHKIWVIFE